MKKMLVIVAMMAVMMTGCATAAQNNNSQETDAATKATVEEQTEQETTKAGNEETSTEANIEEQTEQETTKAGDEETSTEATIEEQTEQETTKAGDEETSTEATEEETTEAPTDSTETNAENYDQPPVGRDDLIKGNSGVIKTDSFVGNGSGEFFLEVKWYEYYSETADESVISWVATYAKPENDEHPNGWAYVYGGNVEFNGKKFALAQETSNQAKGGLVLASGYYTVKRSEVSSIDVACNIHIFKGANNFTGTGTITLK